MNCIYNSLNSDPLDFLQRDLVSRAVVELGRPRALMSGHCPGVLQRAVGLQVGDDAGLAEGVAADGDLEPDRPRPGAGPCDKRLCGSSP